MSNSPSYHLAYYINSKLSEKFSIEDAADKIRLFVGKLPKDSPMQCISIMDTSAASPNPVDNYEVNYVTVLSRDESYVASYDALSEIKAEVEGSQGFNYPIGANTPDTVVFRYSGVWVSRGIMKLGEDDKTDSLLSMEFKLLRNRYKGV